MQIKTHGLNRSVSPFAMCMCTMYIQTSRITFFHCKSFSRLLFTCWTIPFKARGSRYIELYQKGAGVYNYIKRDTRIREEKPALISPGTFHSSWFQARSVGRWEKTAQDGSG